MWSAANFVWSILEYFAPIELNYTIQLQEFRSYFLVVIPPLESPRLINSDKLYKKKASISLDYLFISQNNIVLALFR